MRIYYFGESLNCDEVFTNHISNRAKWLPTKLRKSEGSWCYDLSRTTVIMGFRNPISAILHWLKHDSFAWHNLKIKLRKKLKWR